MNVFSSPTLKSVNSIELISQFLFKNYITKNEIEMNLYHIEMHSA